MLCQSLQHSEAIVGPAMTNHLFQATRTTAQEPGSQLFLETPSGFALTYSDMIALSGRYALALRKLGLETGDRVAAQVEKSPQA